MPILKVSALQMQMDKSASYVALNEKKANKTLQFEEGVGIKTYKHE